MTYKQILDKSTLLSKCYIKIIHACPYELTPAFTINYIGMCSRYMCPADHTSVARRTPSLDWSSHLHGIRIHVLWAAEAILCLSAWWSNTSRFPAICMSNSSSTYGIVYAGTYIGTSAHVT